MIKFSVAMCVYAGDDPLHLKLAVDSVLNQTVKPDEIVLVIDGKVPSSTIDVIERFPMLKVIHLPQNYGLGIARQKSLQHCTHDIVAIMDADDICASVRFEKQLAVINENKLLSVVGSNIAEFRESPENIHSYRVVPQRDSDIKEYMKKRCPINHMTVMLRKSDIEKAGGYKDWHYNEDYYLWIRMSLMDMRFENIYEPLVYVRMTEDTYRRRGGWRYFISEAKIQYYMFSRNMIQFGRLLINITQRIVVQLLLPNCFRRWIFNRFARKRTLVNTNKKYK